MTTPTVDDSPVSAQSGPPASLPELTLPSDKPGLPSTLWIDAVIGLLIGLFGWRYLGFNHVLRPSKIAWLLAPTVNYHYYDAGTVYCGWNYFRHAPWTFPLGLNKMYGMEYGGSIAFSDSLPPLALIFKPFSRWLGTDFQYVGIWFLICFLLQGLFGALLASTIFKQRLPRIVVTALFVLSPIMLERSFDEYSLTAHWPVLWALYLYLRGGKQRFRWAWIVLGALTVSVHFYIVAMVLMVWLADAVRRALKNYRAVPFLGIEGICMAATVAVVMWALGYFSISVKDAHAIGFGMFATNILGPLDAWGSSSFFMNMPRSRYWRGEGFCYFGMGMLILSVIAAYESIRAPISRRAVLKLLPLIVALCGLAIFSLSDKPAFGTHVVQLPNIYFILGQMFRSSGRMFWPAYYGIWLAVVYLATRGIGPRRTVVLLLLVFVVQVADMQPWHVALRHRNSKQNTWGVPFKDPFWATAGNKYRHIVAVPSGVEMAYVPLAYWGANHGLSTNSAYLGRYPGPDVIQPITVARIKAIQQNRLDPNTIYIVPEEVRFSEIASTLNKDHGIGRIDGYNIIAPFWFANGTPAGPSSLRPGGTPLPELGPAK